MAVWWAPQQLFFSRNFEKWFYNSYPLSHLIYFYVLYFRWNAYSCVSLANGAKSRAAIFKLLIFMHLWCHHFFNRILLLAVRIRRFFECISVTTINNRSYLHFSRTCMTEHYNDNKFWMTNNSERLAQFPVSGKFQQPSNCSAFVERFKRKLPFHQNFTFSMVNWWLWNLLKLHFAIA